MDFSISKNTKHLQSVDVSYCIFANNIGADGNVNSVWLNRKCYGLISIMITLLVLAVWSG